MKHLIFDVRNVVFRRIFGLYSDKDSTGDPHLLLKAFQSALVCFAREVRIHEPDKVVFALDGRRTWRHDFTSDPQLWTPDVRYKQSRVAKNVDFRPVLNHTIGAIVELLRTSSNVEVYYHSYLEADDLIAGYADKVARDGDQLVCISSDKDFVQLYRNSGFTLHSPGTLRSTPIPSIDMDGEPLVCDALLHLYSKCLLGDASDSIPPVCDVLPSTIAHTFEDKAARAEFFSTPLTVSGKHTTVGGRFLENKTLIDLTAQPMVIRDMLDETLDNPFVRKFDRNAFVDFCHRIGTERWVERDRAIVEMLQRG